MKRILLALFALSAVALADDESVEPPLQYKLTVGGKSQQVSENKPFEIGAVGPGEKAVLSVEDQRVFAYRGVRFPYPRYFTFEADVTDPENPSWTLSGTDLTIMLFAFGDKLTPQQFAENLAAKFGSGTKISKVEMKLGGQTYAGVAVDATIAGQRMLVQILSLPSSPAQSMLLMLQDAASDDGKHSAEYGKVLADLEASFAVSK